MKVVLDTNIIFNDFHLNGAKIKGLCESVKSTGDSVYIPEIVVDESINKYREEIQKCTLNISKSILDFQRLTQKEINNDLIPNDFFSKESDEYAISFKKQLSQLGIKIIPYPSTSHVKLVKRDLSRKRPFQENGKGYRDALIWESVKNICKKSSSLFEAPEIIFVNKNHTDFCKHDVLHPDLKEDLVNHGINEDYVEIVNDIDIFIQKYIKPKQKILKDILLNINKNKYYKEIDFKIEVEKRTSDFLLHREFDYEESPFRQEFENPSIVSVDDISYTVTDVRQISEEEILIEIEVDANCEFDFFIFKSDAICMDNDELPNIWSSDWNKHYMGASDSKYVKLEISLIVDSTFSKIQSDNMKIIPTKIY